MNLLFNLDKQRLQRERDEIEEQAIIESHQAEEEWKEDTIALFDARIDDLLDEFTESQVQVIADCYVDDGEWFRNAVLENLRSRRK